MDSILFSELTEPVGSILQGWQMRESASFTPPPNPPSVPLSDSTTNYCHFKANLSPEEHIEVERNHSKMEDPQSGRIQFLLLCSVLRNAAMLWETRKNRHRRLQTCSS